jgi:hypothetical protein
MEPEEIICRVVTTGKQHITTDFRSNKYEPKNGETVGNGKDVRRVQL